MALFQAKLQLLWCWHNWKWRGRAYLAFFAMVCQYKMFTPIRFKEFHLVLGDLLCLHHQVLISKGPLSLAPQPFPALLIPPSIHPEHQHTTYHLFFLQVISFSYQYQSVGLTLEKVLSPIYFGKTPAYLDQTADSSDFTL